MGGALLALAIFTYWAAAGSNRGWTKTQVPIKKVDEVTQIEFIEYQKRFVPGVEFLGAGIAFGVLIVGFSFFPRRK